MGRTNIRGTIFNRESYDYYNKSYNAYKSYYKRMGYTDLIPIKMNRKEWEMKHSTGESNKEIVYNEFHKYSKEQAKKLTEEFKKYGYKTSVRQMARGEITAEQWNYIKKQYHDLLQTGKSSKDAAGYISYQFWGSP